MPKGKKSLNPEAQKSASLIHPSCVIHVRSWSILHPSQKSKEPLQKKYNNFIRSGTNVSNNHMSLHIICSQSVTRSLQLYLMTWKVLDTTGTVISALLPTFIASEIIQNQNHQPQRGIAGLVHCRLVPSSHQSAFFVKRL